MSTVQTTSNKAAIRRFHGGTNTGDLELISKTIDELGEPDALIRTPLPIQATGAQALKEVFARLLRVFPDLQFHDRGSASGGAATGFFIGGMLTQLFS